MVRSPGLLAGLGATLLLTPLAAPAAQSPAIQYVSLTVATEKAPRIASDWVVWTSDAVPTGSTGTVLAKNLATSQLYVIGPGFLPDVDVYDAAEGGGAGVPAPGERGVNVARVAYLRLESDGTLSLLDACFTGTTWDVAVLASDLGYADQVRVSGNYTAWTSTAADGTLAIHLHDGESVSIVSAPGAHAFRPTLARDADGGFALVWDAYLGARDDLDYEVFGSFRAPGQPWSAPENLSAAPLSEDLAPALAPALDGGWWIAWASNRGALFSRVFVAHRAADGTLLLPDPYPPSSDPAARGLVDLADEMPDQRPQLQIDAQGRPWLIVETKPLGDPAAVFDKRLLASVYDGADWSTPVLVPGQWLGEKSADAVPMPNGIGVVYQINSMASRTLDVAWAALEDSSPFAGPDLSPPAGPPAASLPYPTLQLPVERTVLIDGAPYTLLFADLHSHCGQSPDGLGERDRALFWARDVAHVDAWASTDHDTTQNEPLLDWEYELARRLVDKFDAPAFTTFMGFEWSNNVDFCGSELIGHRATFSSSKCYRFTDPSVNELPEYYAAMSAEDAIGVPHHLGKFGGASFLQFDPFVQPVTEVCSIHGQFEDKLIEKLVQNQVRFGVTAAGDDHLGTPGFAGLAGVVVDPTIASRRDALKQALRDRRCFGVRRHGMFADLRLDGRPMGESLTHAGDLLLRLRVSEIPDDSSSGSTDLAFDLAADDGGSLAVPASSGPVNVNISRDGDYQHPVYSAIVPAGGSLDVLTVLPGSAQDAFYMLRVTRGYGISPADTLLWSSPIWVDAEATDGYPVPTIAPRTGSLATGTPFVLALGLHDPEGLGNLADVRLHVTTDGKFLGTLPLPLLLALFVPALSGGDATLTLALQTLPPGTWGFVLEARDKQGHSAVAGTTLTITP